MKKTIVLTFSLLAVIALLVVIGNMPITEQTTANMNNAHSAGASAAVCIALAILFNWILPDDNKQVIKQ